MRNLREPLSRWPIYPVIVVAALIAHGATADALPIAWSWRAIVTVIMSVTLLQIVASVALRNLRLGALGATVGAFWLLGAAAMAVALLLATLLAAIASLLSRMFWRPVRPIGPVTRFANVASLVLAVMTGATVFAGELGGRPSVPLGSGGEGPDIFVILLDGYPRADTLADQYDFDNSPFLLELERRGFDTAERSESNYNSTALTLASMLDMRHVDDIGGLQRDGDAAQQRHRLRAVLGRPQIAIQLRQLGYGVKMIGSAFPQQGILSADEYVDSGQLNAFEIAKIVEASAHGPWGRLAAGFLASQHRERISEAFDAFEDDLPGEQPRLVLGHVLAPHTPFVFGANGEALGLQACFPASCGFWDGWRSQLMRADFSQAAVGQISYLNRRVLDAVDLIVAHATRPPVIVIMSDHGSRSNPADPEEMFHNLFAAYTPGHRGLFGRDTMPVSIFPRLLRTYLGVEVPEPDRRQFFLPMDAAAPLDYKPYRPG
jgi:hypothetical protein